MPPGPLAGLVLATLGVPYALAGNALSFLVVIGASSAIRRRPFATTGDHGNVLRHFREGIAYVRQRLVLVVALLMVMLVALLGVSLFVQLVEPFSRHVLDVGPGVYGLSPAATARGAVAGGACPWCGAATVGRHPGPPPGCSRWRPATSSSASPRCGPSASWPCS